MTRSLQRHLSLMLGGAILLCGLLAALASFFLAYLEAKEFQDDMLRQVATLSAVGATGPEGQAQADGESAYIDPESRILIVRMPRNPRPDWLADDLTPGFHTVTRDGERLRVFIHDTPSHERTAVAQPTDARDEIAINSALRILIPLLLLLPALIWLIVRIVRRELAPVARLSRDLDGQAADRPMPIAADGVPDEITPFVHAINRLLERVNHLIAQQRRFIADAAHELRTPLTALSLQVQNLQQAGSLQAMQERIVPLQAGITRARQLAEQLLSLAGTEAGTVGDAVVDVPTMVRELIAEFLPQAEARGIDLGLEETARFALRAPAENLRLILGNALENALKYTPTGGEVTIRLRVEEQVAVIEIVDNGPGIPVVERERAFDAFYRLPGTAESGSGLGLSIARQAARRLGGVVSLHDRHDGAGLVFRYQQKQEQ